MLFLLSTFKIIPSDLEKGLDLATDQSLPEHCHSRTLLQPKTPRTKLCPVKLHVTLVTSVNILGKLDELTEQSETASGKKSENLEAVCDIQFGELYISAKIFHFMSLTPALISKTYSYLAFKLLKLPLGQQ